MSGAMGREHDNGSIDTVVAVAGASGNVGGQVVEHLAAVRDLKMTVVFLSRRAPALEKPGITYRCIDYGDEASLRTAFVGVDTLVFPGSDGDPNEMMRHHRNVVGAASACKVRRIVYLSALDLRPDSKFSYARIHQATEELLRSSSLSCCVLRASIFTEFFVDAFVRPALSTGVLRLPSDRGRVSFVSRSDVATAMASAVINDVGSQVLNITGTTALDLQDVVSEATQSTGRPLRLQLITEQEFREQLAQQNIESHFIDAFATMTADSIPNGGFELTSGDILPLLPIHPRSFRDCVRTLMPRAG